MGSGKCRFPGETLQSLLLNAFRAQLKVSDVANATACLLQINSYPTADTHTPLRVRALPPAPVARSTPRTAGLTACQCLITTPGQSAVSA